METFKELVDLSKDNVLEQEVVDVFISKKSICLTDFYNEFSVYIAKQFIQSDLSFADADGIMNDLWALWVVEAVDFGDGFSFAEPAYSIFEAFDSGEYYREDGEDPIEKYTKPELLAILETA